MNSCNNGSEILRFEGLRQKFCTSSKLSSLKDAQQFVGQMAVIWVTLPSSIVGSTCTRSPWGNIFQVAKNPRVDRRQLVEGRIAWMHSGVEGKRQKVVSPASVPREFWLIGLFVSECLRGMPHRMGEPIAASNAYEWAIQYFAPWERFF
jgi:hypothetical protein